jgi:cytochrome b
MKFDKKDYVYVWSKITRYFHWLLVVCIVITFVSSAFESAFLIHISFGIIAGGLLTFRLIWGFTGPKYAKFKSFDFSLSDLFYYLTRLFKDKKNYIGHNPAASWATILLIVFGFFATVSGVFLLGASEHRGLFSFIPSSFASIAYSVHNLSIQVIGIVAIIHIVGALLEHFVHKTDTVPSMIHGYKRVKAKSITTTTFQKKFGLFAIVFSVFLGLFSYMLPQLSIMTKNYDAVVYAEQNPQFAKQCSECHNLFSPTFLTTKMWNIVLEDKKEHFRKDLTQDVPDFEAIKEYILNNTAKTSNTEISRGIIESTKNKNIYRISRTRYWKNIHKQIPRDTYKHPYIKSKSNCQACHNNFGKTNYINDEDITLENFSISEKIPIYLHLNQ